MWRDKPASTIAPAFFSILLEGEAGDVVKPLRARVNLFSGEAAETLQAEFLHRETTHHRAMDHGAAQRGVVDFAGGSEGAHEAPGEAVARARGIAHMVQRHGGGSEDLMAA